MLQKTARAQNCYYCEDDFAACTQGITLTDAPESHRHLRSVTFRVLPRRQWGTALGCSRAGYDQVCPVYLSTKPYPNPTKGQLYLSLWKDTVAGRNEGSWVITWAIAKNRPIDQGNFKAPYGVLAASTATREYDVEKSPGWPGGKAPHCRDTGPGPTPSPGPGPTRPPGSGPTLPPSPRPTPPIITTTTTIPMWTTSKSTPTKEKPPSPAPTFAPGFQCPQCNQGLGPCAQRVTNVIVICSRYTDEAAKTCTGASKDCTESDPTAPPPTLVAPQPHATPSPSTPPRKPPPPTPPRATSTTTINYWTGATRTSTMRWPVTTPDAVDTTTTTLPPNEGVCLYVNWPSLWSLYRCCSCHFASIPFISASFFTPFFALALSRPLFTPPPCLPVSLSPCLPVPVSPSLTMAPCLLSVVLSVSPCLPLSSCIGRLFFCPGRIRVLSRFQSHAINAVFGLVV